jgi:pimeloyl-ACP methyl ester carboxylesterase
MQKFDSDGVSIAYTDEGDGEPALLIHGFASNGRVNWVETGWVRTLREAGFRVIIIDNRGHGESEKLYDPALYDASAMAEDAARLLAHLDIGQAHVMGYSMGARIAAFLTVHHPALVRDVVFAGLAERMITGFSNAPDIAAALEAPSITDVASSDARAFRYFAELTKSDLRALAACIKTSREKITAEMLAAIKLPVLVVAGTADSVAGEVAPIVAIIKGARGVSLPDRNHMNAVGDKTYKREVVAFFGANGIVTGRA